jgi:hypothetical protein
MSNYPPVNLQSETRLLQARAVEILYRVWVSQGPAQVPDLRFLQQHQLEHEYPVDTCLRLAGYPVQARCQTTTQYGLLDELRAEAEKAGRIRENTRFVRDVKGRWVDSNTAVLPAGLPVEHPLEYFPPTETQPR